MEEKIQKKRFSAKDLADKVQAVYKAKKRDVNKVTIGSEIKPPPFFIDAPGPLKRLIGCPGYPGQRIVQISGKPNSGKTSCAMKAMVQAQQESRYVILVETEGKFSVNRFKGMGGDPDEIMLVNATTLEQGYLGLEEYLNVIYSEDPDAYVFIVWDSLGGTPSEAEQNADADQTIQLATAAKVIKRELRKIVPKWIDQKNIAMLIINQNYANIGSHGRSNSGGDGAEYFSSIIIQLSRTGDLTKTVKGEKVKYGIKTKGKVTKNHVFDGETTLDHLEFIITAYDIDFLPEKKKKKEEEIV